MSNDGLRERRRLRLFLGLLLSSVGLRCVLCSLLEIHSIRDAKKCFVRICPRTENFSDEFHFRKKTEEGGTSVSYDRQTFVSRTQS
jgi:hypothetical protein